MNDISKQVINWIISSATKIALLVLIFALVTLTTIVIYNNVDKDSVINSIISLFSNVTISVVSFYFWQKSLGINTITSTTNIKDENNK